MVRKYIAGKVIEKSKFWVPSQRHHRAGRIKGGTTPQKADQNGNAAVRLLARSMNCNCSTAWIYITVKYDAAGLEAAAGREEAEMAKLIRRIRKETAAAGEELRWYGITSDRDGETGETVRVHHHIVMRAAGVVFRDGEWWIGEKSLNGLWGHGTVYAEPLRAQDDYTPLAVYIMRQARRSGEQGKKYSCSRNLAKPRVEDSVALTDKELKTPAGGRTMEIGPYQADTGTHYIRYLAPEKIEKGERKEEKRGEAKWTKEKS